MSQNASATVKIANKLGLHARPAMLFVETASAHPCQITVRRADQKDGVDGKSIMQMMMLAATQGTTIEITACGDGADRALRELIALVDAKFQEE